MYVFMYTVSHYFEIHFEMGTFGYRDIVLIYSYQCNLNQAACFMSKAHKNII